MKNMQGKISVIIPVYNVGPYIGKCLSSLMSQTYDDIEMIVVIDGSEDESESICREYAKKDERITILKQDNLGLSSARNCGLDYAHGEYIMFVDGDDYVAENFCELPYRTAKDNDADMVIFNAMILSKRGLRNKAKFDNMQSGLIDKVQAVEYGGAAAWNKLYRSTLFDGIRYPDGHVYEDVAVTHRLIYKAEKIYLITEKLYYHVYNPQSITQTKNQKYNEDRLKANIIRYNDLLEYDHPMAKTADHLFSAAFSYLIKAEPSDDPLYMYARHVINSHKHPLAFFRWKRKILYFLWLHDERLFHFICRMAGKKSIQ